MFKPLRLTLHFAAFWSLLFLISPAVLAKPLYLPPTNTTLATRQLQLGNTPSCDGANNLARDSDCRALVATLIAPSAAADNVFFRQLPCVGTCCIRFAVADGEESDSFPSGLQLRAGADAILALCPTGEVQDEALVSGKMTNIFLGRRFGTVCLSSSDVECVI